MNRPSPLPEQTTGGFMAALAAFVAWGLLPAYWKTLEGVPALEILCHRIVWSLAFTGLYILATGRAREVRHAFSSPRSLLLLAASGLLIGCNWYVYIYAVNSGHILETSLGYYINPLVNASLGYLIFQDRLRRWQKVAVALAFTGVAIEVAAFGRVPWIALALAFSFAFYGLCRKLEAVGSVTGLFLETALLAPLALAYLAKLHLAGQGAFANLARSTDLLLMGAGLVTSLPLIGFALGAKKLRLTTLGLLQYIAPSIAFILGVFAYGEAFSTSKAVTFCLIWAALVIYSLDSLAATRRLYRLAAKKSSPIP